VRVVTTFWGSAEPDPATVLRGEETADVAVVGGGLAGMSTAWFLKQAAPELRVTLLEQEHLGYGASGRNFGNVPQLTHQEVRYLQELVGDEGVRFVARHQARMLDDYESLIEEQGVDCGFRRLPVLYPAITREALPELEAIHSLHRRFGIPSRLLSAAEVWQECALETCGGLSVERNATVQPFQRARGFAAALRRTGVAVHEGSPVLAWHEGDHEVELRTPSGAVHAARAVFATNAYTSLLGLGPQVRATYTYVLATKPLTPRQLEATGWSGRHAMLVDAGPLDAHFYLRVAEGRLLLGGGGRAEQRVGSLPPHHDPEFHARLVAEIGRRFPPLADVPVDAAWGGPLGMTANRLPILARVSPRRYLNAGFNGRGALIAALSGRVLVGLLLGEEAADPDYLRFGRLLFRGAA
jgi:glycine/D-amino acid oxidase-like deaminating enzyme